MTAVARKRASGSTTCSVWFWLTCERVPPPWLKQTNERCAIGKPTDHTGKHELDRYWSGTGLESPVSDLALSLPAPADKDKRQTQKTKKRQKNKRKKDKRQKQFHSFSHLSGHEALTCLEGQSALAWAHSLFGEFLASCRKKLSRFSRASCHLG